MGNLLQELLTATGAMIVGRSDVAATAIREIGELVPDAVVIDVALSEGNGFQVLEATRTPKSGRRPIRIVLSNHATPTYRNAAARFGADGYFDKGREITKMIEYLARL
jgi:DNA-binding NarL/FixJ family response regulator